MRYIGDGQTLSYSSAQDYILVNMAIEKKHGHGRYAVLGNMDQKLLGFCGFRPMEDYTDFGWRYDKEVWGRGIGTEAAIAVYEYGSGLLGLGNIRITVEAANQASFKIAQKLNLPHRRSQGIQGKLFFQFSQLPFTS
jgi:ribosomal-protein-alanine N-acetyltransferase